MQMLASLKYYKIVSIVPSLAKSKYYNEQVLSTLCLSLLKSYELDTSKADSVFLKMFIERLMTFEYGESENA